MNFDEGFYLNEEARCTDTFQCHACECWVEGYAATDPIELEGELYCDSCASDRQQLVIDGYIKE